MAVEKILCQRSLSNITQVETSLIPQRLTFSYYFSFTYLSIAHQSYYKYVHPFPPFQPLPTLE